MPRRATIGVAISCVRATIGIAISAEACYDGGLHLVLGRATLEVATSCVRSTMKGCN